MRVSCIAVSLCIIAPALALVAPSPRSTKLLSIQHPSSSRIHHSFSPVRLFQSESSLAEDKEDKEAADGSKNDLQRQKQDAQEMLDKIKSLNNVIATEGPFGDDSLFSLEDYERQVNALEEQVRNLESELVAPVGLSMEEFKAAMVLVLRMPYSARCAFCEALEGLDNPRQAAADIARLPEVVTLLYQQRIQMTPQKLQDSLQSVQSRMKNSVILASSSAGTNNADGTDNQQSTEGSSLTQSLSQLFGDEGKTEEELRLENTVKNVLGRVTRKEGIEATQQDLDRVIKALGKEIFVVASTDKIPGGYVIRGRNVKATGPELIEAVDAKLPEDFPCQVSFMDDVTTTDYIENDGDPVLILLNKDFSPRFGGALGLLTSSLALLTVFIFCVSTFGANELISGQLSEANAINDVSGVSEFTERVYDILLPLLCIQVWHELGHFTAAKINKFDIGFPILLPFYSLPFMGAKTDLMSSPPNRSALLDFALAGPLVGIIGSIGCLAFGLQLTGNADSSVLQYFPSLPVSLLKTSALGGSMADYFLGGGLAGTEQRFITMQDPSTAIVMHPLAIAGFCGLIVNSLSLLPLGSTDGGRASLAIFGRYGHALVGGAVWLALLVASFSFERADILISAWLINNIVQNDMEIPCRDETEEVSVLRFFAALSLWLVAILAITPLS